MFGSSFGREENALIYGYGAGIKYFVAEGGSINFKLNYYVSTYKDDDLDKTIRSDETSLEIGF